MAASHLVRLGKLKGDNGILNALKHNKRVLQSKRDAPANIDVTKTPLNYALVGHDTPVNIRTEARVHIIRAGIERPRKNAVMGVEVVFSLPIDRHTQNTRPFFEDCLAWTQSSFAGELLSFDVHLDESAPHAHAIILPLIDNKLQGNKMVGNTGNLYRLINDFHKQVGRKYGLSKNESKRVNPDDKKSVVQAIKKQLASDSVMKSKIWPCVRDAIQQDPLPYAQLLGVEVTKTTSKTFVGVMTSKGKGNHI